MQTREKHSPVRLLIFIEEILFKEMKLDSSGIIVGITEEAFNYKIPMKILVCKNYREFC